MHGRWGKRKTLGDIESYLIRLTSSTTMHSYVLQTEKKKTKIVTMYIIEIKTVYSRLSLVGILQFVALLPQKVVSVYYIQAR